MIGQGGKDKALIDHDRAHAGAPVGAGNADAVGGRIDHTGTVVHDVVDLGGRDILALPTEGVADAVDEMEEALVVELHQIAGAEPGVTVDEDIAKDLLLRLALVGIALETTTAFIGGADAADGFSDLAPPAGDAEAVSIAQRRTGVGIDLDDPGRKAMREQRRDAANRARLALDVE